MEIENIVLSNDLVFEKYNDVNHESYVKSLSKKPDLKGYISSFGDQYILKYQGRYSGYLLLKENIYMPDSVNITIVIDKDSDQISKQSQSGFGTNLMFLLSNFLLNCYQNLVLEIAPNNLVSKNLASKLGFQVDDDLYQRFIDEGYNYVPYVRKRR